MHKGFSLKTITFIFTLFLFCVPVSAGSVIEQIDNERLSDINTVISKSTGNTVDFKKLLTSAINGQLDLSPGGLLNSAANLFFSEMVYNKTLIKSLLLLAVISAVITNLSESFKTKSTGEIGFYVCYIVLVSALFSSFNLVAGIVTDLIGNLGLIMQSSLPMMLSLLALSGSITGAYLYNPIMLFAISFLTTFIQNILLPFVMAGAAIKLINYIADRDFMSKAGDLIESAAKWTLKGICVLFLALLSLQKISAPILDNIAVKTAKTAASAVPVVGGMLGSAFDSVMIFSSAAKSGVMVALIVSIVLVCAVPLVKSLVIILTFKLIAAVIEPICDPRIVKCLNSAGNFSFILLGAAATAAAMFIFAVVILLSF